MNVETAIETLFGKIEDGSSQAESARADVLAAQFAHTTTFGKTDGGNAFKTHRVVWTPTDASIAAVAVSEGRDSGCGGACVILHGGDATPPVILGCDVGVSAEIVCAETEDLPQNEGDASASAAGKDGLFAAVARLHDLKGVGKIELDAQVGATKRSYVLLLLLLLLSLMLWHCFRRATQKDRTLHACSARPSSCVDAVPITSFSTGKLVTVQTCWFLCHSLLGCVLRVTNLGVYCALCREMLEVYCR
jgi:hypothetical protein